MHSQSCKLVTSFSLLYLLSLAMAPVAESAVASRQCESLKQLVQNAQGCASPCAAKGHVVAGEGPGRSLQGTEPVAAQSTHGETNTAASLSEMTVAELIALRAELQQLIAEARARAEESNGSPPTNLSQEEIDDLIQQLKFRLYGFVKLEASLDNSEVAQGDWLLFARPGNSPQAGQNIYTMNARHSRIGGKIDGPAIGAHGRVKGLIEFDFAGGFPNSSTASRQPQPRLRHAWVAVTYPNWEARFGQDWALISGPFPNTTSFVVGAGKGNLWMRFPQINFTYKHDAVKMAVSINRPIDGNVKYEDFAGGDFDPVGDGERSGLPWFMARTWLTQGKTSFSISGHFGRERCLSLAGVPHTLNSYSFNGDLVTSAGPLQLTVRGFYGANLNTFLGGVFQGVRVDSLSAANIISHGGWAQMLYSLSSTWKVTAGGGFDNPENAGLANGMRTRNDWLFANVSFSPAPAISFMLESQHLRTSYLGLESGNNTRVQFVTYFRF